MSLAIFDLDNTLLSDDSDHLWGSFLVEQGLVNKKYYAAKNDYFYQQYKQGCLDIYEFLDFSLQPLTQHDIPTLRAWNAQFMHSKILPIISEKSWQLLDKHRQQGDYLLIITATNLFVTKPIAELLKVDDIIAPIPEIIAGKYSGKITGIPSFQEGKIQRLESWLKKHPFTLEESFFYSDSHNDLSLLKAVGYPVAVDPDETLQQYARDQDWPIISLR